MLGCCKAVEAQIESHNLWQPFKNFVVRLDPRDALGDEAQGFQLAEVACHCVLEDNCFGYQSASSALLRLVGSSVDRRGFSLLFLLGDIQWLVSLHLG